MSRVIHEDGSRPLRTFFAEKGLGSNRVQCGLTESGLLASNSLSHVLSSHVSRRKASREQLHEARPIADRAMLRRTARANRANLPFNIFFLSD